MEHRGRVDGQLVGSVATSSPRRSKEVAGDGHADLDAVVLADVGERPLDLPAQVPGDAIWRFRCAQIPLFRREQLGQAGELRLQTLGEEPFVETRLKLLHLGNIRRVAASVDRV